MKCPACERENRESAGFCAWCGVPISGRQAQQEAVSADEGSLRPQDAQGAAPPQGDLPLPGGPLPSEPRPENTDEAPPAPPEVLPVESPTAGPATPEQAQDAGTPTEQPQPSPPPEVATGPLPVGQRLGERFEIAELLESTPERNTYRARDLRRCAACGSDDNTPGSEFCGQCGASLDTPTYATLVEQLKHPPEHYDLRFEEQERDYFVTFEPSPAAEEGAPSAQPAGSGLRLIWGKATHPGMRRDHNEDYLEAWLYARGSGGTLGLFVVADGLGGQDSGEVASRMTTDAVWQSLRPDVWEPIVRGETLPAEDLEEKLTTAILAANKSVYDARVARGSMMSSTLTLALIVDDMACIGNVGDSRTYLWNAQGLKQVTKDHSLVQRLVDMGQILPDEIYTHPQRNLIYQSVGDRPEIKPDIYRQPLAPDDRLVLCSDGLWEMVRNEGLEEVLLAELDPQRACERLVHDANLAGGEDNISVIIVAVQASGV